MSSLLIVACPQPARINASHSSTGSANQFETNREINGIRRAPFPESDSNQSDAPKTGKPTINITGRVVKVVDGDTIDVLDVSGRIRVRLAGIDAPESKQEYGAESRQNLVALVLDRAVEVESHKTDQHGRSVGKVLLNGEDVGLQQLRSGLAWHYKDFQKEQTPADRELYANSENIAKSNRTGLWSNPNPIPPWIWRRMPK